MRILILAHFAGSPYHGMVMGHYYLAREWTRMGHHVTIVASSFSHVRFRQPEQPRKPTTELIDGIEYLWIPVKPYNALKGYQRALNILEFTLKLHLFRNYLSTPELVICSSHHPLPIFTARRLACKFRVPLVFEVRDLWPLTLIELGRMSRHHPFIRLIQFAEDYAYRHADKVVSVLPAARDYMTSRGMKPEKFVYVPNGIDPDEALNIEPLPSSHVNLLEELRKKECFIVGYAGKTGLSNALQMLLEAIRLTDDSKIVAVLLGTGPDQGYLKKLVKDLYLEQQIFFLEPVPKRQVVDFLKKIDVAYVGVMPSPLFKYGMSITKLNDCMLAGTPIIAAIDTPENIVSISGAGITCPTGSPKEISEAILTMKNISARERIQMGEKGRQWIIQHRDYRSLARKFLQEVLNRQAEP